MSTVRDDAPKSGADTFEAGAHAELFGFPPAPVRVAIKPRTRAWRVGGAARTMAITLVVAPAVAIVPPHAPWLIGAFVGGSILARRRFTERFTLIRVEGECPKCSDAIHVKTGRLKEPHPLPCEGCHHQSSLRFPEGLLDERAVD